MKQTHQNSIDLGFSEKDFLWVFIICAFISAHGQINATIAASGQLKNVLEVKNANNRNK